jgi:1,4-alpha-glucan branching enzyme
VRVAFLASEYPPHTYGGLGTAVEALSRFLGKAGVEVTILVPDVGRYADTPAGVELWPIPVEGAVSDADYWLTYCESALTTVRRTGLRADVVHSHDWMTAVGALAVGRAIGAPVLMSVHLPQSVPVNLVLENVGLVGSHGVLVNSEDVRAELAARELGGPAVAVIPNGVDLAEFPPADPPPDPHRILFVGRLVPQKGVDVLVRAFGAVLRRHPGATLVIAGDGQQRLYLERLTRFLGVRQHVTFLGWQSRQDLAELYRTCAVTAVPSRYEPFGLVALEAMASARPVVVSRVGGLAEIVDHEAAGFVVQAGDHLDLATRLAALLTDPNLARSMGIAARRRAEQFDWATIASRTIELYDSLPAERMTDCAAIHDVLSRDVPFPAHDELRERILALLLPVQSGPE